MTGSYRLPSPPAQLVAEAERDYREVSQQLAALIATARTARTQHATDLNLFIHLYATIRRADPTRAVALAAVAVLCLTHHSSDTVAGHEQQSRLT